MTDEEIEALNQAFQAIKGLSDEKKRKIWPILAAKSYREARALVIGYDPAGVLGELLTLAAQGQGTPTSGAAAAQPQAATADNKLMKKLLRKFKKVDAHLAAHHKEIRVDQLSDCSSENWKRLEDAIASKYKIVFNCTAPCCLTPAPGLAPSPQNFEWGKGLKEDHIENVKALKEHLQGLMPSGIIVLPVEHVCWLSANIISGCQVVKLGSNLASKTDFVLMLADGRDALDKAMRNNNGKVDSICIEDLLPYMVGLYEAKTSKSYANNKQQRKWRRQAVLEYLAVNHMHISVRKLIVLMGDGNDHVCVHPDYSSIAASRTGPSQIHVARATPALLIVHEEMQESPPIGEAASSSAQAAPSAAGVQWLFIQNIVSRVRDQTIQVLKAAVQGVHAAPKDREDGGAGGGSGDDGGSDDGGDSTGSGASEEGDSSTDGGSSSDRGSSAGNGSGSSNHLTKPSVPAHASKCCSVRSKSSGRLHLGAADGVGQEAGCEGSWPKGGPMDVGLAEAAREHHFAQAFVQVISEPWMRKGLGIPMGQPLVCQPPSLQDFAASFRVPTWALESLRDS